MSDSDSSSTNHSKDIVLSESPQSSSINVPDKYSEPISLLQLSDYIDTPATLIIDIRSSTTYSTARIPHALSFPINETKRPLDLNHINDLLSATAASRHTSWASASCILIYDASSSTLLATSAIHHLAHKFIAAGFKGEVTWLSGGFEAVWLHRRDLLDVNPLAPECNLAKQPANKAPSTPTYPGERTVRCKTANAAYNHATKVEHAISDALAKSGLKGSYLIQAGFNEELVSEGRGTLEEIYIFLDCKLPICTTATLNRLRKILAPFPGVVYTPKKTHYILPKGDYLELAKDAGIYTWGLEFAKSHDRGPDTGDDDNKGSNNSSGHHRPKRQRRHKKTKDLSIPFISKIMIKDDGEESLSTFTASAVVNYKLAESPRTSYNDQLHPDGWHAPWFGVQIPTMDTSFSNRGVGRGSPYHLSFAQMRIIASSCPSCFLVLYPRRGAGYDGVVRLRSEPRTGGTWPTLSGLPRPKVEAIERKWEMEMSPCLGDRKKRWAMWRCVLNKQHPDALVSTAKFDPGPEALFGQSNWDSRSPQLDVELLMCWSTLSGSKRDGLRFQQWFSENRGKEDPKAPGGFANMLHQASVYVDLEELAPNAWAVNLNPKEADEAELSGMSGVGSSVFEPQVKDERLECEVVLGRALHGQIQRREDQTNFFKRFMSLRSRVVRFIDS